MAQRDVSLLIKAKDEGSKAFDAVADALGRLLDVNKDVAGSAQTTGSKLEQLALLAIDLDKAYATVTGAADKASAAFDRQGAKIAESKAQLAALEAQAQTAARAMARLQSDEVVVDAGLNGTQAERIAQLKTIGIEYDRLVAAQDRLKASIAAQEGTFRGQQSAMQQLGSTVIAAEQAQLDLAAATAIETDALEAQAAAAQHLSAIQKQIESTTGVSRLDASGSAERSASVLAEVAAHDALIQKLKSEQAATIALADAQEAQMRFARFIVGEASGKSARDSASVFTAEDVRVNKEFEETVHAAAVAEREMETAAAKLRAQIDPLAALQNRFNSEMAEAIRLHQAGKISATEFAAAETLIANNAKKATAALTNVSGARGSIFGLKPWELQNLSFQINDVFTQLASGASLTQTLAQQGGQIIQIEPVFRSIVALLPQFLAVGTAIGTVYAALSRVFDLEESARHFNATLAASAEGLRYNGDQLAKFVQDASHVGVGLDEGRQAIDAFLKAGLAQDRFPALLKISRDVAEVTGKTIPDAARQLAEGFNGGYASVAKLDDQLNVLTLAERENIRAMFESGDVVGARNVLFEVLSEKMSAAAEVASGPFASAMRELGQAWTDFLDDISNTAPIRLMIGLVGELAGVLRLLGGAASGTSVVERAVGAVTDFIGSNVLKFPEGGGVSIFGDAVQIGTEVNNAQKLIQATADLKQAEDELAAARKGRNVPGVDIPTDPAEIARLEAAVARLRAVKESIPVTGPADRADPNFKLPATVGDLAGSLPTDKAAEANRKRASDMVQSYREQFEALKDITGEQRVQLAGATAYRKVLEETGDKEGAAAAKTLAEKAEQLKVDKQLAEQAKSAASAAEAQANAAESRRKAIQSALTTSLTGLATGDDATLEQRLDAITAKYDRLRETIQEARKVGLTEVAGMPLADFERTFAANEKLLKQRETEDYYRDKWKTQETQLSAMVNERNSQVETYNELVAQGVMTESEAQEKRMAAFAAAKPEIDDQIAKMKEMLDLLVKQGAITSQVYDSWAAKLDLIKSKAADANAGAKDMSHAFLPTGLDVNLSLTEKSVTALTSFVDQVVAGKNALTALRDAFLQFASDFLREMGTMILRQAMFNLWSGGSPGGMGGVGGAISGAIGSLFHDGGVVGRGGRQRAVRPEWFQNAVRMHTGGVVGLRPDEVPAILQRGERVRTANQEAALQQQLAAGRGRADGSQPSHSPVKVVNLFDPESAISQMLDTPAGERGILNVVGSNADKIKAILGS